MKQDTTMPTFSGEDDAGDVHDDNGSQGEGNMVSQTLMSSLMTLALFFWCNLFPDWYYEPLLLHTDHGG